MLAIFGVLTIMYVVCVERHDVFVDLCTVSYRVLGCVLLDDNERQYVVSICKRWGVVL